MKVSSESDNEVEISPYWIKIEANELHRLGNPTEYVLLDTESMPDLVSLSRSEASNESVICMLDLCSALKPNQKKTSVSKGERYMERKCTGSKF